MSAWFRDVAKVVSANGFSLRTVLDADPTFDPIIFALYTDQSNSLSNNDFDQKFIASLPWTEVLVLPATLADLYEFGKNVAGFCQVGASGWEYLSTGGLALFHRPFPRFKMSSLKHGKYIRFFCWKNTFVRNASTRSKEHTQTHSSSWNSSVSIFLSWLS